ncbi:ceramide glucosyltransferase [Sinisalibacter aestuarii]|uniref:Ceramide glucosyltransferase n=1 Tax=Sinisalibacter aestuarii TaxID=2949426 RepID=A0ABQ5LQI0_9RHOB|nr:ceramide glucosyltransferase [Sinisalibacter aestuarii]GKY86526.1 ceramide glucosyltransferase [Sinisalibacter aestuarii]
MIAVFMLSALVLIPLGVHLATSAMTALRYGRSGRPVTPEYRPYVSLIRPVCGVDTFDRQTLAASFTQDYPDYEVLICAASEDDPAVALARDLVAAHPEVPARVLVGEDMISANPKLNNLAKGVRAANGKWMAVTDSNLLLPPDYLSHLVDCWQGDTGLVSGPPVGIWPGNFWGAVECAFLNTNQARWQLAADSLGMGFAQGKTLFLHRAVLDAAGGLSALGRNLAEDVAATKVVRAQGLKVRLPTRLFPQPIGERTARSVWARQLRWSRVRRDGFPLIFLAEIAQGPALPLASLAGLVALGAWPGWILPVLPAIWYGSEWALARYAAWPSALRDVAAMMVRDALLPPLWLVTFARRGFTWRGTEMAAAPAPAE